MMRLKDKIVRRMVKLAGEEGSPWTAIESRVGSTLRRTWTHDTPDYMRPSWDEDTYDAHVFLTLVAGKFILGTSTAPWVGRQDREIPLWEAEMILEDPELALDTTRRLAMRDERKRARS